MAHQPAATAHTSTLPLSTPYTLGSAAYQSRPYVIDHVYDQRGAQSLSSRQSETATPPSRSTKATSLTHISPYTTSEAIYGRLPRGTQDASARSSPHIPHWVHQVKVTPGVAASKIQEQSPPSHIEAFGRRARDPAVLQGVLNSIDITARVRSGQGLGPTYDPRDRQRIPEENRVIPERIISGQCPPISTTGLSAKVQGLDSRTTVMVKDVPVGDLTNVCNHSLPEQALQTGARQRSQ